MPQSTERIYDTTTVDPDTVTETSRRLLDEQPTELYPKPKAKTQRRNGEVESRTIAHPGIWAKALKAVGGDVRRIKVHSWTRVEILD